MHTTRSCKKNGCNIKLKQDEKKYCPQHNMEKKSIIKRIGSAAALVVGAIALLLLRGSGGSDNKA